MAKLLAAPTKNAVQKTLAAQLLSTATTGDPITFDDVDGIPNLPGVLVINRVNSSGTATPSSREYIEYSGTSGTTVLITTRNVDGSNAALTHAVGSIVEFIPDVTWADRIYDALASLIDVSNNTTIKSGITLPTPNISLGLIHSSGATISGILDDDTMATASATTIPTSESVKEYVDANAGAGGKFMFVIPGTLATGTDLAGTWFVPDSITIDEVDLYVDTAGATGTTTIDVNLDNVTIFSSGKPSLSDTATSDLSNVPTTTSATEGQKITIDCDAVTSTAPQDVYVIIKYS